MNRPLRKIRGEVKSPLSVPLAIYTDGSFFPYALNPGMFVSGWAYVTTDGQYGFGPYLQPKKISGKRGTDVAELRAMHHALQILPEYVDVTIHTDSLNALNTVNQWRSGSIVMPLGYQGRTLHTLRKRVEQRKNHIHMYHVKGHDGNILNECVDSLAKLGMRWCRDRLKETYVKEHAQDLVQCFFEDRSLKKI